VSLGRQPDLSKSVSSAGDTTQDPLVSGQFHRQRSDWNVALPPGEEDSNETIARGFNNDPFAELPVPGTLAWLEVR
jgi:hypothetical protein